MRGSTRLWVIALVAVCAASAHADADTLALGYADAAFYQMSYGSYYGPTDMVITSAEGPYNLESFSTIGSDWSFSAGTGGLFATGNLPGENAGFGAPVEYSSSYGSSASSAQVDGAGAFDSVEDWSWTTVTNETSNFDYLVVNVLTAASVYASSATWNDGAYSSAFSEFYDTDGKLTVFSGAYAQANGLGGGGTSYFNEAFDTYDGYSSASGFLGNSFPSSVYSSASNSFLSRWYVLLYAPGQTDTFYTVTSENQRAFSITPGPIAAAPFGLGLLGRLRRRRKWRRP